MTITNQTLWLDPDGLRVGNNQLVATNGAVGVGTNSSYGAFTAAGTGTQAAAVFLGNVGIGSTAPQYALDINGNLNAANFATDPGGVIQLFNKNITASYTIPSGKNALSVGNITVATGASVTVPTGSRWVVL